MKKATVWKYALKPGQNVLEMPHGAEILTVQMQGGEPMLWARVNSDNEKEPRTVTIAGTGHDCPLPLEHVYISTFQMGPLVWHAFVAAFE
jgi:hypothetical protein